MPDDRRRLLLRAALGFLQLPTRAPELRLLHVAKTPWAAVQQAAWSAVKREVAQGKPK